MKTDVKIGLVLGVGLIGIVAALFFRREPVVKDDATPPPITNVDELDEEIAGKQKAPYIKGLEDDATAAPVPAPTTSGKPAGGSRTTIDDGQTETAGLSTPRGLRVDPSNGDATPAHNREWEPTGPAGSSGKKSGGDTPRGNSAGSLSGTGRTHVIQSGDTLSGLAAHYLGSSGRYREIFEANRDQLKTPNDVREGMTLKIPDGGAARDRHPASDHADNQRAPTGPTANSKSKSGTKARTVSRQDSDDEDDFPPPPTESSGGTSPGKIRFVPVHRGPFSAGRTASPGTP